MFCWQQRTSSEIGEAVIPRKKSAEWGCE